MAGKNRHPLVSWAETNDAVFVTIQVSDVVKPEINISDENLAFSCTTADGATYSCDLKLKGAIDSSSKDTKWTITGRDVQFHLEKKESERWEGLLENKKLGKNLVKPDWDKWVDSDDEGKDAEGFDMSQFGGAGGMGGGGGMPGMGGGGMPGMGGGGMPGMGGGMPGMGGMGGGMPGMGGMGGMEGMDMAKMAEMMKGMGGEGGDEDGDDEDDDDDLPHLEAAGDDA